MATTIKPLKDRILVRQLHEQTRSKGGIHIPETSRQKPMEARVVAIGDEIREVKKGDHVLFAKYGGIPLQMNGMEHLMLGEGEVLAVFEGDD